ncbi:MAG: hypothetical protein U9R38_02295 [Candidatus Margulisiibacteriota bacterium]|nr:hypothetical protein [Candidatus Margulisiibacteriota bacterium]
MAQFGAEGAGVHPGKPIIWPTGKAQSSPVNQPQQTQTTGNVRTSQPTTTPTKPTEVAPTQAPQTTSPAAPAKPAPSVARPLTVQDIRTHLLNNLQINPSDFNTKLASLMLRNGLELSRANFVKLSTMLQGTNKSQAMQDAAVLLLMKGIDSPQAVKVLGQYFSENPGMASQMMTIQEGIGNLTSALGMGKGLLDSSLISQLNGLLSQFDENFQSLSQKFSGKPGIGKNLINDVRALKALMQGLQQKAPTSNSAEAQVLSSALTEFQSKMESVLQNLLAQSILSQKGRSEVNYQYHQVPNAMTDPPKDLEIVIKRQGEGKNAVVDPRNTQVTMSMETANMGKMVVSMIVKDGKVYVIFVFSEKDHGNEGRGLIAKEFGDLQEKLAKQKFMITGYQVKVDPAMCNIKPYLIPMIPSLEALLKKIDIEA